MILYHKKSREKKPNLIPIVNKKLNLNEKKVKDKFLAKNICLIIFLNRHFKSYDYFIVSIL